MSDVGILDHSPLLLPAPRGPYGVATYDEIYDSPRPDLLRSHGTRHSRHQVWYPTAPEASARSSYINASTDDLDAVVRGAAAYLRVPTRTLGRLPRLHSRAMRYRRISSASPSYPAIYIVPDVGGFGAMATNLACQLASAGFIVIAVEQPHVCAQMTLTDGDHVTGRPLTELAAQLAAAQRPTNVSPTPFADLGVGEALTSYLAEDLSVGLDRWLAMPSWGRYVDANAVGVVGLGWGGAVAARVTQLDSRFGSCLTLDAQLSDAVVSDGLDVPAMFITRDVDTMREEDRRFGEWPARRIAEQEQSIQLTRERTAESYLVRVPGMFHADFCDAAYWFRNPHRTPVNGTIDPEEAADHLGAYSRAFFNRTLQLRRPALLESAAAAPRGVLFERSRATHRRVQRADMPQSA